MANEELIDSRVSVSQCKRAVEALHSHQVKKEKEQYENELLPPKEQAVWLVVAVKKMHPERKIKPFRIPVQHPLVDPRTTGVCLITKDPQREYKDLLAIHGIKFISRVVGIAKLKGKFKPYEARRVLLKENGMFLADERVIPLLPSLLGKKWFEAKKQPIPVCLTRKDLKGELEKAINSTYMHQNRGTCTSVKIGTLSYTPLQILANIKTAVPAIAKTIKGGWDNIQSFYIKTASSVSLPIWSCNLDESAGGRWGGLVKDDAHGDTSDSMGDSDDEESRSTLEEDEEEEDEVDEPVKTVGRRPHGHGKKKAVEESEPPKKKAKLVNDVSPPSSKQIQIHQAKDKDSSLLSHTGKRAAECSSLSNTGSDTNHASLVKKSRASLSESSSPNDRPERLLPEKTAWPPLRTKDLGSKRGMSLVEKKKLKLLNGRLGRSAKNAVLGKKTARG